MERGDVWLNFASVDGTHLSVRSSSVFYIYIEEPLEDDNGGCAVGITGNNFDEGLWIGTGKDGINTAKLLKSHLVAVIDHAERYGFGRAQYIDLNAVINMTEDSLVERLSDAEHKQWMYWARIVATQFEQMLNKTDEELRKAVSDKIAAWQVNFIPYQDLSEELKDYDRAWARKAIDLFAAR